MTDIKEWKDVNPPTYLYKYRDWNKYLHKRIITELEVYISPPTDFVDDLDCRNNPRFDLLTDPEIWQYYNNSSHELNNNYSDIEHMLFADEWLAKCPLKNKDYVLTTLEEQFKETDMRLGILSLTWNPARNEMWEMYGAMHTGFCVGFVGEKLIRYFGGGGIIQYVKSMSDLPVIKPFEDYLEQATKQTYYKTSDWEFEDEYRLRKFHEEPADVQRRQIKLNPDCYKEIIFGAKISEESRNEIIEIAKNKIPHILFKQAHIAGNKIVIKDF